MLWYLLRGLICWLCLLPATGLLSQAQTPSSAHDGAAANPSAAIPVKLGESAAELDGVWKFRPGDDPSWSQPDFNDASWGTVDLSPPAAGPGKRAASVAPGWTEQGYAGYSGYAWYRLHVDVEGGKKRLAILMPDAFDDAYQVYINGHLIGSFGSFGPRGVTAYAAFSREYPLPREIRGGPMTIAIRTWMDSATPFNSPDAGGLREPPLLGYASAIGTEVLADWYAAFHALGSGLLEMLVLLLVIAISLTHFWMDRGDKAYVWLALVCLATLIGNAVVISVNFFTWIPLTLGVLLADVFMTPLRICLWVLFWAYWFRVGPALWLKRTVWALILLLAFGYLALRAPLYGPIVPVHAASIIQPVLLTAKLLIAVLLLWVVYKGIQRRREGWIALPAVILTVLANYQRELRLIHIKTAFFLGGYRISLGTASTLLSLVILTLMLSRRFLLSQRRQARWGYELEQASEVQRLLIPSKVPQVPGLFIEGDYRPAREVGGDFFQIIPNTDDGSVLLIVGDVTGKGVSAGMLVALIVGVLHTAAHTDPNPIHVLETLNNRLCERGGASATCLVLKIAANGDVLLVNAGHLPPYRNGVEIEMEGALPLGTIPGVQYSLCRFHLAIGDTLMLMSDGIAEAQNERGDLFGFDRIADMLRNPTTAADLAEAAQTFGQEDDILVLRVERQSHSRSVLHTQQSGRNLILPRSA